jgi:hypothetical protein
VSAPPLAASLIEDEIPSNSPLEKKGRTTFFLEPKNSLKRLWERFSIAMNSVGPISVIVVKNHSHQALTSA